MKRDVLKIKRECANRARDALGDNRYCGFQTKQGLPCRAHAQMAWGGEIIGCHLHDPRRKVAAAS